VNLRISKHTSISLNPTRLNKYPRGLGKGYDAAVVGAWLAQEVTRINLESAVFLQALSEYTFLVV
jgi:hypothetical protein